MAALMFPAGRRFDIACLGRLAVDVIHDDEVATGLVAADLIDRRDILVMERSDEPRFVEEHRHELIFVVGDVDK